MRTMTVLGSLAGTMSILTLSNSLLAILAGLLADLCARFGFSLKQNKLFHFFLGTEELFYVNNSN